MIASEIVGSRRDFACQRQEAAHLTARQMHQIRFAGGDFIHEMDTDDLHDSFEPFEPDDRPPVDLRRIVVELPVEDGTLHYVAATFEYGPWWPEALRLNDLRTMIRLTAAQAIQRERDTQERAAITLEILICNYGLVSHEVPDFRLPAGFADGWTGTRVVYDAETGTLTAQIHPVAPSPWRKVGPSEIHGKNGAWTIAFRAYHAASSTTTRAVFRLASKTRREATAFVGVIDSLPDVIAEGRLKRGTADARPWVEIERICLPESV